MSLKGVEMQIAVPRTSEATNVQNHLNQKPTYDQAALANESAKKQERLRKKSETVDASDFLNVREDGAGGPGYRKSTSGRRRSEAEDPGSASPNSGHPYKGKHIDISL